MILLSYSVYSVLYHCIVNKDYHCSSRPITVGPFTCSHGGYQLSPAGLATPASSTKTNSWLRTIEVDSNGTDYRPQLDMEVSAATVPSDLNLRRRVAHDKDEPTDDDDYDVM